MFFGVILGAVIFLAAHFATAWLLRLSPLRLLNFVPRTAEGPLGRRIAARFAGPVAIYLLASGLFAAYALGSDRFSSRVRPADGTPAAQAGVQDGDRVVAIDGVAVTTFDGLRAGIRARVSETIELRIERNGQHQVLRLRPDDRGMVGIIAAGEQLPVPVPEAIAAGLGAPFRILSQASRVVFSLFSGEIPVEALGGPVAVAQAVKTNPGMPLLILSQQLSLAWPGFLLFSLVLSAAAELGLRRRQARSW